MKLEDQVVSLELAKKLKELGVEQRSYFFWYPEIAYTEEKFLEELYDDIDIPVIESEVLSVKEHGDWELADGSRPIRPGICSAYTVWELGDLLPCEFHTDEATFHFLC